MLRWLRATGRLRRPSASRHSLLLLMALVLIFSAALILRLMPARYGFYLNEFDPYFDFYATKFLVNSVEEKGLLGLLDYLSWRDTRAWYPEGRQIAPTSQVGLHLMGAFAFLLLKDLLGVQITLYDFLVLLPPFLGALTIIPIFLLGRKVAGGGAGLMGALLFAFSPPIIHRGNLGWFKSEPLALLLAISASYLFLASYDAASRRERVLIGALAGFLLGYANASWGGSFFFSLILAPTLVFATFLPLDLRRLAEVGLPLLALDLITSALMPRPGISFLLNPLGLALLLTSFYLLLVGSMASREGRPASPSSLLRALMATILIGLSLTSLGLTSGITRRYLTVLYPYLRTVDPLVESVAEHALPTGATNFQNFLTFIFIAGLGALLLLRRRDLPALFALTFSFGAFYVAASFSRLLVFSSLGIALLAGVGFSELAGTLMRPSTIGAVKRRAAKLYEGRAEMKVVLAIFLFFIFSSSLFLPPGRSWIDAADAPVSLASSALSYRTTIPDWIEALRWIRANTPPDAIVASWWDYGYWISIMGERTTLADNATINGTKIALIGRMFMSDESEAIRILDRLGGDYVVIFIAGQKFRDRDTGTTYYMLGGGGDESKKQWFIKIGLGRDRVQEFLYEDEFTPKDRFWETFLGKLMPFEFVQYAQPTPTGLALLGPDAEFRRGLRALYTLSFKYPREPSPEEPMRLAFVSSGLTKEVPRGGSDIFAAVLVYERVK